MVNKKNMKIYSGNTLVLDIEVDDDSYRYRAVKGENTLVLKFSLAQHVEIPTGSYCDFQNERYTLKRPENLTMNHTRSFDYTLEMHAAQYNLASYKLRNTVDRRLKFSYTAQPQEHLQLLVDNLNERETGWSIGECITGTEKVISYNHTKLLDALNQIADTFETEWEISGKTISLHKVEYNRDNPLTLSYGRDYDEDGNAGGFKPGLGRTNFEDSMPVEILYVQGGSRNIDASKYGSADLLLPKGATLRYDGAHFEDEEGFDATKARGYMTGNDAYRILRLDKALKTGQEDSLDCTEVYPHRDEKILKVIAVDPEKNWYDVVTDTPESLNYREYGIGGETPTIVFQSGMLSGREFDLESDDTGIICEKYYENDEFVGWKFQIVPAEIDGFTMPGGNYLPAVNDVFRVFGIQLPDAYIEEDETKTGASWEMFREGIRYFYGHEDERYTFTGTLDGIWAKKDWLNIGGKIRLGGFISFRNTQFQPEPVLIRITGIKDYVNNPYSPEIELSNGTKGMSVSSELNQIASNEAKAESQYRDSVNFTKRRFRDAQETISMLEGALLAGFDDSISPLTVQTMMMLVGDQSLQFRFVDSKTNPQQVVHNVEYSPVTKTLTIDAGIIQHMTLGIDSVSTGHSAGEYKFWTLQEFTSPVLAEADKKYYVYAKVSETDGTGTFYMSETAKGMNSETGYYYLLMGLLNSEFDGDRSYVSLHGFTEVLPGQITTDVIRDTGGNLIIDLANKRITAKNGAMIDGNITIGPGSSGLGNLSEWDEAENKIDTAYEAAMKAVTQTDVMYYLSDSPYVLSGGEWVTTAPTYVEGKYVWTKTVITYADKTTKETAPVCIVGADGQPGEDGVGILSIVEEYYLSDSPTELTGGLWSSEAPEWTDGSYIWTRTTIYYSNGTFSVTDPICVTGPSGGDVYVLDLTNEVATVSCDADGNVLSDMPECTAKVYKGGSGSIAYSGFTAQFIGCSGTINKASGIINLTQITADTAQVIVTVEKAGPSGPELTATMTITKVYPGATGEPGQPGADGKPSTIHYLLPSTDKIVKGFTGEVTPKTVTCVKMKQTGDSAASVDTDSSVVIKYQRIGEDDYEMTYSGAIEITENTTSLVFSLYDGSTLVDKETLPVLNDAAGLEIPSENLMKFSAFEHLDGLVNNDEEECMIYEASSSYDNIGNASARIYVLKDAAEATSTKPAVNPEIDMLMWPETLMTGQNLIFSMYLRGVSGATVRLSLINASTDIIDEAEHPYFEIKEFSSSRFTKYTFDLGKVSFSESGPMFRLWFSKAGNYYINSPMLTYGNVQGLWEASPKDAISDLDYLKQTFGYVVDVNGVVLGKLVAVKDEEGNVRAMINGSDLGKETFYGYGKLLFASGMDDIQNPETAKTKIYEDGTIDTEKLMAREGQIADMLFTPAGILTSETETTSQGYDKTHYLSLRAAGLNIGSIDDRRTTSTSTSLNRTMKIMAVPGGGMDISDGEGMFPASVATIAAFGVSSIERGKSGNLIDNIAILIEAKGHASPECNLAIKCLEGMFAGLRPKIRYATSTRFYPDEFDHTIISSHDSGTYRIYLPASPKAGQQYYIIKQGSHTLYVDGNGHNIHRPMVFESASTSFNTNTGNGAVFVYDPEAEKWWMHHFLPSDY